MDKEYLFNPFNIKNINEYELQALYKQVFSELNEECNTMWELSHNIEVYSNLNYIVGEIIARLKEDVITLKTQIEIDKAIKTTEERMNWNIEVDGKAPALDYFKALATRFSQDNINKLAKKEGNLERFKNTYKTIEEKINALKKKQEAIKFEEFNER